MRGENKGVQKNNKKFRKERGVSKNFLFDAVVYYDYPLPICNGQHECSKTNSGRKGSAGGGIFLFGGGDRGLVSFGESERNGNPGLTGSFLFAVADSYQYRNAGSGNAKPGSRAAGSVSERK